MPDNGFIITPRRAFKDDPLWEEKRAFSKWEAWQDLIQRAQYKEGKELTGWNNVKLQRGQVLTSISALSKAWGRSRNWVRLLLKSLSDWDRIRTSKGQSFIIVTICNYDIYQSIGSYVGHQKDTKRTLTGHQKDINGTHTKKEKKERQEKNSLNDYDRLIQHISQIKFKRRRAIASDVILSSNGRIAIKKLFDAGLTFEQLRDAITNFQDSLDRGNEEWLKTPMMISAFFSEKYSAYLPGTYRKKEIIGESKGIGSQVQ